MLSTSCGEGAFRFPPSRRVVLPSVVPPHMGAVQLSPFPCPQFLHVFAGERVPRAGQWSGVSRTGGRIGDGTEIMWINMFCW